MIVDYMDVASDMHNQIAEECETVAKVATECARNAHPEGPHSPDYFLGYAEAMNDIAVKLRLRADLIYAGGTALNGNPDNVVPLRPTE